MEPTIELDLIGAGIEDPSEFPDDVRRQIRRVRDKLRETEDAYNHFHWYGPEYEGQDSPESPDWYSLINQAVNALQSNSKDLWICAWLIEALVAQHGFGGLRDGFRAAHILVTECWDDIQPSPQSEDGIENAVKMIGSLNDTFFVDRINSIPISEASDEKPALSSSSIKGSDDSTVAELVSRTDVDFFVQLTHEIAESIEAFDQLTEALGDRCGDDAPPSAKIRETLLECQRLVRGACGHLLPAEESDSETELQESDGVSGEMASVESGEQNLSNRVQNREDAFRVLEKVAEYFRTTEPHSPVSYGAGAGGEMGPDAVAGIALGS